MRRYSEIPNTPTPFSKASNDLKIGSILTIPNTGRAVLKYIGPVQGKSGKFVGIELLGESASLGKNSGDVNGIEYFKTKSRGSGLFMTYDKLMSTIDFVESPPTKRLSLMNSPNDTFGPTPRRNRASLNPSHLSHSRSISKRSSIARSHTSTPSPLLSQSLNKSSPSYEELKRLSTAKTLVENEKNNLLYETDSMKYEIEELKSRLEHQEKLIQDLELSHRHDLVKIQKAEERVSITENKLVKQKNSHEEQREELLDVIDQLEAQVNDNEKLYVDELQRLQDEIKQKEENIKAFGSVNENRGSLEMRSHDVAELETQIEQLRSEKLQNETALRDFESRMTEADEKLAKLNKESLYLKQSAISDQKKYESDLKEAETNIAKLKEEDAVKERVIEKLREEIKLFKKGIEESVDNNLIEELQRQIANLEEQLKKNKEEDIKSNSTLQNQVKSLQDQLDSSSNSDRINELEFKLENKMRFIKDLQDQLVTAREKPEEESINHVDAHQLRMLKEELEKKDNIIKDNETMLKVLDSIKRETETLREEVIAKQKKLEEKEIEIKTLKNSEDSKESTQRKLDSKDKELISLRETMSDLQKQLRELQLVDQKKSVIETERADLDKKLKTREAEINSLNQKINQLKSEAIVEADEALLEERNIEIDLLKEEILQLKSKDKASEVEELKNELNNLKKLNLSTTNNELNKQLELLQDELKVRPSMSEFQELRSELELIDELRKVEAKDKDNEIKKLQILLKESTKKLTESTERLTDSTKQEKFKPSQIYSDNDPKEKNRATMSNLSLNRPPVISQVVDGALQIYVPDAKDPANGRKLWCGLCEREGHDSIDCPYENDIF